MKQMIKTIYLLANPAHMHIDKNQTGTQRNNKLFKLNWTDGIGKSFGELAVNPRVLG